MPVQMMKFYFSTGENTCEPNRMVRDNRHISQTFEVLYIAFDYLMRLWDFNNINLEGLKIKRTGINLSPDIIEKLKIISHRNSIGNTIPLSTDKIGTIKE